MGRIKRVYYKGVTYHVSTRGNNKQMVLKENEDKERFLQTLSKYRERFKFRLFGFVLMDNHVHLVMRPHERINISKIMQAVNLSYSQKFRKKYKYTGYVWQGRFNSGVIESDAYIISCLNYIHNNPKRAKIVNKLEDYIWSSWHFYKSGNNPLSGLIQIDKFIT